MLAVPRCREAAEMDGEQVARRRRLGRKKIEKIRILSKTSWEGSGGGFGGSGGSGNPVGLERLVDSMTSKLPPTTKIVFRPVLFGSGSARLVRRSKKVQKTEDNARFDSKNAVFPRKNGRFTHPSWPAKARGTPSQVEGSRCLLAQRPPSGAPMQDNDQSKRMS